MRWREAVVGLLAALLAGSVVALAAAALAWSVGVMADCVSGALS